MRAVKLTGRCSNGFERDGGRVAHALPNTSWVAVCGAIPVRGALAGWSSHDETEVTCAKCVEMFERLLNSRHWPVVNWAVIQDGHKKILRRITAKGATYE